ncbi:MAG TPA: hypothetical protein VHN15_06295 [Thermoanaerobaculia bacterium]|nr:hypothetical protein [Thermoanaerobaculia bacterium]
MEQREVRDADGVTWTCVQAFAGLSEGAAEEAAEKVESAAGTVPVVCTPSGGEQSVRVELPRDWQENLPDGELLATIERGRG